MNKHWEYFTDSASGNEDYQFVIDFGHSLLAAIDNFGQFEVSCRFSSFSTTLAEQRFQSGSIGLARLGQPISVISKGHRFAKLEHWPLERSFAFDTTSLIYRVTLKIVDLNISYF